MTDAKASIKKEKDNPYTYLKAFTEIALHHQVGGSRNRDPLNINYVGINEDLRTDLNGVKNSLNRLGTKAQRLDQ